MLLLKIKDLSKHFGGLRAVSNVDFDVHQNDIMGVIGPNGSGKTTLFNLVSGFLRPTSGQVIYKEESISGLSPDKIAKRGIARTFQHNSLLPNLTVEENIAAARYLRTSSNIGGSFFHTRSYVDETKAVKDYVAELMSFVELDEMANVLAKNLPHGQQRVLGIAMALAEEPNLILLDEPATGVNAIETAKIVELIKSISKMEISVMIIEHHMRVIMGICNRIIVLSSGIKIAEGTPQEVSNNEEVIAAYLGVGWQENA